MTKQRDKGRIRKVSIVKVWRVRSISQKRRRIFSFQRHKYDLWLRCVSDRFSEVWRRQMLRASMKIQKW